MKGYGEPISYDWDSTEVPVLTAGLSNLWLLLGNGSGFFQTYEGPDSPPHRSSQTVNKMVLLASPGNMLLHSMTIAWGIMITQDTIQITTMLFLARLAVLLNIRG